jgi:hypothetical protein
MDRLIRCVRVEHLSEPLVTHAIDQGLLLLVYLRSDQLLLDETARSILSDVYDIPDSVATSDSILVHSVTNSMSFESFKLCYDETIRIPVGN